MKRILIAGGLLLLVSCKTSSHKCDAYGSVDPEFDIHKVSLEQQKKYTTVCTIKEN